MPPCQSDKLPGYKCARVHIINIIDLGLTDLNVNDLNSGEEEGLEMQFSGWLIIANVIC